MREMKMNDLKIKVVQFNPTVGDIGTNSKNIIDIFDKFSGDSDIIVFPECAVTGYPIQDMALNHEFQISTAEYNRIIISHVVNSGSDCILIFGSIEPSMGEHIKANNVAFVAGKSIAQKYIKRELPIYGIFDESRTFRTDDSPNQFTVKGHQIGVAICEDLWHPTVIQDHKNCDLVISLNGSPFETGKRDIRKEVIGARSSEIDGVPILYVNLVGSQDEIIFDGSSFLMTKDYVEDFPAFQEGVFDVTFKQNDIKYDSMEETYCALVHSLRDFCKKNNIYKVIIGCSGGMDSALVSAIAVDALHKENVLNVSLPSKYTSGLTHKCVNTLIDLQKTEFKMIPIMKMIEGYQFLNFEGLAEENLQARIRGDILCGLSNSIPNSIVLGTSNKSEISMGYGTLYGDLIGGFNPLKDVFKSNVFALAKWRNSIDPYQYDLVGPSTPIPEMIIERPPSAELREDQKDTDSLLEYSVLDRILEVILQNYHGVDDIVEVMGIDKNTVQEVFNKVMGSEFKRVQSVPGTKVTSTYYGKDRRYPFTNKWKG